MNWRRSHLHQGVAAHVVARLGRPEVQMLEDAVKIPSLEVEAETLVVVPPQVHLEVDRWRRFAVKVHHARDRRVAVLRRRKTLHRDLNEIWHP